VAMTTPVSRLRLSRRALLRATAAGAALANAVSNALGVEVKKLPLKPDYVLQLIKDCQAAGKSSDAN